MLVGVVVNATVVVAFAVAAVVVVLVAAVVFDAVVLIGVVALGARVAVVALICLGPVALVICLSFVLVDTADITDVIARCCCGCRNCCWCNVVADGVAAPNVTGVVVAGVVT